MFGGRTGDRLFRLGRTTYRAYSAYALSVRAAGMLPSDRADPRLLSDALFTGEGPRIVLESGGISR